MDPTWLTIPNDWVLGEVTSISVDRNDNIMKFTMAGERVLEIGRRGQSTGNLDTENVHQATDIFVDTQAEEAYAADGYGNNRVIVFDSETGNF